MLVKHQNKSTYLSQWDYTLRDVEYFGGVVLFTIEQFEKVNGYHTNYWGWGMEDDDLFWRCYLKGYYQPEVIKGAGHKKVIQFDGALPLTLKYHQVLH